MNTQRARLRFLAEEDAARHLSCVGLSLNQWKGVAVLGSSSDSNVNWDRIKAPTEAARLFPFCWALTERFFAARWVLFQFDQSSAFSDEEELFLISVWGLPAIPAGLSILIEGMSPESRHSVCDLALYTLMFGGQAYVATSSSDELGYVGIHDGYVYFLGGVDPVARARAFSEEAGIDATAL